MAIAIQIDRRPVPDVPYEKDAGGRVSVNCDAELMPLAHNEKGVARNHAGRVFVHDGDVVRVLVEVNGREHQCVARFTASAKPGKMNCAYVDVRAEGGVDEPAPPEPDPAPEV